MSIRSVSALVLAVFAAGALAQGTAPQEGATPKAPVQAIWKVQEVPFYFQSFTTFYSCDSLEAKLKRILVAVGANPDLKLRTRGCYGPHQIARTPHVQISLVSAVEATPEALAERDKDRSTRDLVARVRGATEEARRAEEQFPAEWRRVSLSRGKLYLEPGDCELIEQMKDKLFPKLGVKIVDDDVKCSPNQLSMNQPRLTIEALFAMPKPDEPNDGKK